jgi:hypothetical protein
MTSCFCAIHRGALTADFFMLIDWVVLPDWCHDTRQNYVQSNDTRHSNIKHEEHNITMCKRDTQNK